MKEVKRFNLLQIRESRFPDFCGMLIGTGLLNSKAIRIDDIETGDVIFYEPEVKNVKAI